MSKLLLVTASVRQSQSNTRHLADHIINERHKHDHTLQHVTRDVGLKTPDHPNESYTIANYTPAEQRTDEMKAALAQSDELIDELAAAEQIIFAVPMYNFCVPSTFKAYIDNMVRIGRTFAPSPDGCFQGLLTNKKVLVITARGAMYSQGSPIASFDHQEPWMKTVLGFIGMTDVTFVHADGLDFGGKEYRESSLEQARKTLDELAHNW